MSNAQAVHNTIRCHAFGRSCRLDHGEDEFHREDGLWRLSAIYEPFLASRTLPKTGNAVDVGAGFGAFSIPFALAYPGWTIWSFEPDPHIFAALQRNIEAQKVTNIRAFNIAIGPARPIVAAGLGRALRAGNARAAGRAARKRTFFQSEDKTGFVELGHQGTPPDGFSKRGFATLPANVLSRLSANLIKFVAPGCEQDILKSAITDQTRYVVGELWQAVPSRIFARHHRRLNAYLPLAGTRMALRQGPDPSGRQNGLDIVVSGHGTAEQAIRCIRSLVADRNKDIRILAVDDGSVANRAAALRAAFRGQANVELHSKPKATGASARNFGRMLSDRTHIAFVDADTLPEVRLFSELLELARYTGRGVVQAGCGRARGVPGFDQAETWMLGRIPVKQLPASQLMLRPPWLGQQVFRRDFLEHKSIWFPEQAIALDEIYFQMLTLYHAGEIPVIDRPAYNNIVSGEGAGDRPEGRGLTNGPEMFRLVLKRAVLDGWGDLSGLGRAYLQMLDRSIEQIREDRRDGFLKTAAEFWAYMCRAAGLEPAEALSGGPEMDPAFVRYADHFLGRLGDVPASGALAFLDLAGLHEGPDRLREPVPPSEENPQQAT